MVHTCIQFSAKEREIISELSSKLHFFLNSAFILIIILHDIINTETTSGHHYCTGGGAFYARFVPSLSLLLSTIFIIIRKSRLFYSE